MEDESQAEKVNESMYDNLGDLDEETRAAVLAAMFDDEEEAARADETNETNEIDCSNGAAEVHTRSSSKFEREPDEESNISAASFNSRASFPVGESEASKAVTSAANCEIDSFDSFIPSANSLTAAQKMYEDIQSVMEHVAVIFWDKSTEPVLRKALHYDLDKNMMRCFHRELGKGPPVSHLLLRVPTENDFHICELREMLNL